MYKTPKKTTMKGHSLTPIFAICIFANTLFSQNWIFQTVGMGVKPAIAIDSQNQPHIAFMLESTSAGFVKHAVLTNGNFQTSLLGSDYYYGPLDIAIGPNDLPAVVTHDHNSANEIYFYQDNLLGWQTELISHSGHDGWDNSIAFDDLGYPHTSSINPFGAPEGIEYAYKDITGWHKETVVGTGVIQYQYSTSLALDSNGRPHIVYYSLALNKMLYITKVSGAWIFETVDETGGLYPSLVLDANDVPHIAYYDQTGATLGGIVKYIYKSGGNWIAQNVDYLYNVPITFTGARRITSLRQDTDGKLHLCYGDRDVIKYANLENGSWAIETLVNEINTAILLGAQTSLALDNNNIPHITYFEIIMESPLTGNVIYARPESCVADLVVENVLATGTYQAANTVVTSGEVTVDGKASFLAGDGVLLDAGFCVPAGSVLFVGIGECQ